MVQWSSHRKHHCQLPAWASCNRYPPGRGGAALSAALPERPRACREETGIWQTEFEYCRAKCRTTSRSTQHENAFILKRRFCFSELGERPLRLAPLS